MNDLLTFDHAELDELLAEIFRTFETESIERIFQKLDIFWARLAMHIRAEHLHLFPAILKASKLHIETNKNKIPPFEIVNNTIKQLQDDHNFFMRKLVFAIKQMRQIQKLRVSDKPNISERLDKVQKVVASVKKRLEKHNETEEAEVYGWAEKFLEKTELADLQIKLHKEINNLPPRFQEKN